MRLTYSDLLSGFKQGIQHTGTTDTNLISFFQRSLTSRYQTIFSELQNYQDIIPRTASTVADQTFYHNPPGLGKIENATVDTGDLTYPLITVHSQQEWDRLNTVVISNSIPMFIFPRRDDFGIHPIPSGVFTITLNGHMRDTLRFNEDYTTGTISITQGSQAVVGVGTTFTVDMIGRYLKVNNDKYWYRISGFTDTTHITLETNYYSTSASGASYRIGESPELPEEAHHLLITGPIADYYAEVRGNTDKATWFNNVFWTGDGNNNEREDARGGLLGLKTRYSNRDNSNIIERVPSGNTDFYENKLWATSISEE